jgi:hypothetical protein
MSTTLYNILISSRNCLIYIASFVASAIALYFACTVTIATIFFVLLKSMQMHLLRE